MPVFALLPIIVIGIVIAVSRSAAEQKKRAEQARRAAQMQAEAPEQEGQTSYTPVRPSVQIPGSKREAAATAAQKTNRSPLTKPSKPAQSMHPGHDYCALRPDDPKADDPDQHPDHELCSLDPEEIVQEVPEGASAAQGGGMPLNLAPDAILNGVIFSEVFGKPKALR